ncbi:hypothetical protein TSOC_002753 [Tetrabaena socialis]|uniref:Uncharacterized protein n=1 Tax=Tetrabaena socialis TaxID=47790 RepID=A0A2J8ADB6_9CHLO|nr:hypothetical protein TSOC_002753 [Tetrabaena socialis]|eukprot:PNH10511.1 hypothetical protein TSOC_002753 [Tetrabaena socialis]
MRLRHRRREHSVRRSLEAAAAGGKGEDTAVHADDDASDDDAADDDGTRSGAAPHHQRFIDYSRKKVDVGTLSLLMLHLARLGYGAVSREDNPIRGRRCCSELLLMRVRRPGAATFGPGI